MQLDADAYRQAIVWIREAGERIKEQLGPSLRIQTKTGHSDLVTAIDRDIEAFFVGRIREFYPDHGILGEENMGNTTTDRPYLWIIDPIDGTSNLINRRKDFAVSVALAHRDRGVFGLVYDVMGGNLYRAMKGGGAFLNEDELAGINRGGTLAEELLAVNTPWQSLEEMRAYPQLYKLATRARGVRVYGATTIELCELASGRLGGFAQYRVNAWDYAASRVILEEIGGKFSDLQGNDIGMSYSGGVAAASLGVHEEMIRLLNESPA